jgi:hypothetical protein
VTLAERGAVCVIGAGFTGLGVAKALRDRGIAYDHLEKNDDVGGNWLNGVYDSVTILSSRKGTGYAECPMPDSWPDFPNGRQFLSYLRAYADHYSLRDRIEFGREVVNVEPLDANGLDGWRVVVGSEEREYAAVVVASGHHWDKRYPYLPGQETFPGAVLHSKDYKSPSQLEGRILVIGAGNSGSDVAVEAAQLGHPTMVSVRGGNWFMPRLIFGRPMTDILESFDGPLFLQRLAARAMLRISIGPIERYGLPKPDHKLFDKHPTVASELLRELRLGTVLAKPAVERIVGNRVRFADGSEADFDTIVCATGFNIALPFIHDGVLQWEGGVPLRVGWVLLPNVAGLYLFGFAQPRGAGGPIISDAAQTTAEMIEAQEHLPRPLVDYFAALRKPNSRMLVGVKQIRREVRLGRRIVRVIVRFNGTRAPRHDLRAWRPVDSRLATGVAS